MPYGPGSNDPIPPSPSETSQAPTSGSSSVWAWVSWAWKAVKWPFIIVGVIVLAAVLLPVAATSRLNLGGLIGSLLGLNKSGKKSVAAANTVAKGRITQIGEPDSTGRIQAHQEKLSRPWNPFRDKSVVKLNDGTKVKLPDGIQDTDVDLVVHTSPDATVVRVADDNTIKVPTAKTMDEVLAQLDGLIEEGERA